MNPNDDSESQQLYKRAENVIPGGVFGHYGYAVRDSGPKFFSRAEGSHFWDVDQNEFIDFMCAYGPMILGYNNETVDKAAQAQYRLGNTVSLAAPIMVELAEKLVDMVSIADWALFGKNGADSTSLAVMVARAATGREKIVKIRDGYHGAAPWMQAGRPGTIPADGDHVLTVDWNDLDNLAQLIDDHSGEIACFISSPYDHPVMRDNTLPAEGYWQGVETLCKKHDIVLIVDDVRSGFRLDLAGSNEHYGFHPDLICFGKAIGNGYPLSALVGTDALKQAGRDVYYSGTQFFNAAPMAAALATLSELERVDATAHMTAIGEKLGAGLIAVAAEHNHTLVVSGIPAMPFFRLADVEFSIHQTWIDECVRRGLYMLSYHNHFISTAHSQADVDFALKVANDAFLALARTGESQPGLA